MTVPLKFSIGNKDYTVKKNLSFSEVVSTPPVSSADV